ncbi:hypothetical protein [Okeania sp. SIO3B5]|uniref:hypothetical protein n=1 Tax=Okeania sp. SIO3B5 TaxID=2607811 RepID=UPI0025DEAFF7|nr:hypothetical protein [Okeania sp. SIO3B5]
MPILTVVYPCEKRYSEDDIKAIAKELLKILDYLHSRQPPVIVIARIGSNLLNH